MMSNSTKRLVVDDSPILGELVSDTVAAVVINEPRELVNPGQIAGDAP